MSKVMHYGLYAKKQRSYFRWGFSFLGFPVCWRGFLVNMFPFLSDPSLLLGPLEGEISKVHFLCGRFYLGRLKNGPSSYTLVFLVGLCWCNLCTHMTKDLDHILWRCQFAPLQWDHALKPFGVSLASSSNCASFIYYSLCFCRFEIRGSFHGRLPIFQSFGTFGLSKITGYAGVKISTKAYVRPQVVKMYSRRGKKGNTNAGSQEECWSRRYRGQQMLL